MIIYNVVKREKFYPSQTRDGKSSSSSQEAEVETANAAMKTIDLSKPFQAQPYKLEEVGLNRDDLAEPDALYCNWEDVKRERKEKEKFALSMFLKERERVEAAEKKLVEAVGEISGQQNIVFELRKKLEMAEARVKKLEEKIKNWRYQLQDLSDEYDFFNNDEYKEMISKMEIVFRKKDVLEERVNL